VTATYSTILPIPKPVRIPKIPPTSPRIPASTMNIVSMSEFFAPIAFITPISRVLSITDVNIAFAMFTPPTNKEISAIPVRNIVIMSKTLPTVPSSSSGVRIVKSIVSSSTSRDFISFRSARSATSSISSWSETWAII